MPILIHSSLSTTAILISRFLMDLQEASNHSKHQEFLSSFGSHHMSNFIGSLGSSLHAPGLVNHSVHVPIHSIQHDSDSSMADDFRSCSGRAGATLVTPPRLSLVPSTVALDC